MEKWKMPPSEKVYEAFSVLADRRCTITGNKAAVLSSDGSKAYTVSWSAQDDGSIIIVSNDNASRWQGYIGYPIIAVLLQTGKLTVDPAAPMLVRNIPWNSLNKAANRNYAKVVEEILKSLDNKSASLVREEAEKVYRQLSMLVLLKPEPVKKG